MLNTGLARLVGQLWPPPRAARYRAEACAAFFQKAVIFPPTAPEAKGPRVPGGPGPGPQKLIAPGVPGSGLAGQ